MCEQKWRGGIFKGHARHALIVAVSLWFGAANAQVGETLRLLEQNPISDEQNGFMEPSGLSLSHNGHRLLSVSDGTGAVFVLDLDGSLIDRESFQIPTLDLEGITMRDGNTALAVQERTTTLLLLDLLGKQVISEHPLTEMAGYGRLKSLNKSKPKNKSLEGVTVDPNSGQVYVVFENDPRLLISISSDLTRILNIWKLSPQIGFKSEHADEETLDVSGVAFDPDTGKLWIVSDRGKSIFVFDPKTESSETFSLSYHHKGDKKFIKHAEGIALDPIGQKILLSTMMAQSRICSFLKCRVS